MFLEKLQKKITKNINYIKSIFFNRRTVLVKSKVKKRNEN